MPSERVGEKGSFLRGRQRRLPPKPKGTTGLAKVKNVSHVLQSIGSHDFRPGEVLEVEDDLAAQLVQLPYFRYPGPAEATVGNSAVRELRHALWPDPVPPDWIADFNRDIFPCQTDEFDPVPKAEHRFSVMFRLMQLSELSGGTRVILRLAGYLARRGHKVGLSVEKLDADPGSFADIPISFHGGQSIPDADFVVGTYWITIHRLVTSGVKGIKVGLLQGDEPAWPGCQYKDAAAAAFRDPSVRYIAISPTLADTCREKYGTPNLFALPGNGVDIYDFSPRINNCERRNGVCFIHRGVWWKGDADQIGAANLLRERIPDLSVQAAGFDTWGSSGVKYHQGPSVAQMAMMYSTSDFYLSFSQFEGSPLPPLEAMACGCIPIVTPVGVSEYLEDGKNGFLVNWGEPEIAVSKIEEVLADDALRRQISRNGLITARNRPWKVLCSEFENLLLAM